MTTTKNHGADVSPPGAWHSTLDSMIDRLSRIKNEADQVVDEEARTQIIQSATDKLSTLRRLRKRKTLGFNDPDFSNVRVGLLMLEHSVAMRLHGLDSAEARVTSEALNRELERQHE